MGEGESAGGGRESGRSRLLEIVPNWILAVVAVLGFLGIGGTVVHTVVTSQHSHQKGQGQTRTLQSRTGIRWQGSVALNSSGVQLDNVPATTGSSTYTVANSGGALFPGNGTIAVWTSANDPSYAECRNFVLTHGTTNSVQLTSAQDICVRTGDGRTALLKVTSVASDGSTAEAQAIVWGQPPRASPPPQKSAVRWHGSVALNPNGIQLDDVPPTTGGAYTVANSGGALFPGSNTFVAVWTGARDPTYAQCNAFVLTHGTTNSVQLTSAQDICVHTESGRTALLKVTSVASDGSTAEADATIWQH